MDKPVDRIIIAALANALGFNRDDYTWDRLLGIVEEKVLECKSLSKVMADRDEQLGEARKTIASELQRIKDLEQIVKDQAAELAKLQGFQAKVGSKVLSYKVVPDEDMPTYPADALKQAHENGYKEGLAKAADVARMVVQQTREDLKAKRQAIEEAQEAERKANLEHVVAYDLLKMVEAAQEPKP